ncbi:hypothetical protein H312_01976 [Anncaliia algerae PRA339]|uniref:PH domain-containing protein n=1 Tax=Anncaliia algerae PRA339 TaxID=1288291 RepID=A0A059F0X0_9MICR|nr:hypothetical protein H312_01976 [Anncaliia algerae PRA339]
MNNNEFEETKKIIEIAYQIIEDSDRVIERCFDNSLLNLLEYKSKIGTIAHISIYLRDVEFLRKIVCRFDEPKNLLDWLCEKDEGGKTASNLVCNLDYKEFVTLFEKITKNEITPKNNELVLLNEPLDKYTNIMNGYRTRIVELTTTCLIYQKKDLSEKTVLPLKEMKLEYTEDHKKFKLIQLYGENEYVFKHQSRDSLGHWINILQNIMPNRDRTFYFNAFFYKLLGDLIIKRDPKICEIMKLNENLTYYFTFLKYSNDSTVYTQENTTAREEKMLEGLKLEVKEEIKEEKQKIKAEKEEIKEEVEHLEAKKKEIKIIKDQLNEIKSEDNSIELFSFESEDEEKYKFYEAKEK